MLARLAVVLSLLVFLSWPVLAQKFTGTIRGVVTDKSGAVVPNAQVTITNNATGDSRTVATNQEGEYVTLELKPGTYTARVKAPALKELIGNNLVLSVFSRTFRNAQLAAGNVRETVAIQASD